MKLTTKITTLALGLALPLSFVSCKEAEKKAGEAAADVKDKAKEAMEAIPKDAKGIIGLYDKMNTTLDDVKDLESAKKAIPSLEKIGTVLKKGLDAIGPEKLEAAMTAAPELKAKQAGVMKTLFGHMERIKTASPEAFKFIDEKMKVILD